MLTERLSSVVDVGQVIAIDLLMPCSERGEGGGGRSEPLYYLLWSGEGGVGWRTYHCHYACNQYNHP